jgi:beta-galactosidase
MREVKVYSNVENVELLLNEKPLGAGMRRDDTGLRHAPFTWQVRYEPGALRAIATIESQKIEDSRQTAGPAYKIVLTADTDHLISGDLDSLAYLTASVTDENGVIVPGDHSAITFTSYGPGQLLKQSWLGHGTGYTWNAVDGRTRAAFRATSRSGQAVISAYSPGLMTGQMTINVTAPGKPDEIDYQEKFVKDELK